MKNLKIYYISESYINYLRQFDKNVAYNKNTTRPYIGVVYTYNNYNYFAPLASPKPKHKNISSKAIDIFKIKDETCFNMNVWSKAVSRFETGMTLKECIIIFLQTDLAHNVPHEQAPISCLHFGQYKG